MSRAVRAGLAVNMIYEGPLTVKIVVGWAFLTSLRKLKAQDALSLS